MSDPLNDRRTVPHKGIDWKLWGPILGLAITGLVTWGMTQQSVADHARRLDRLEAMPADLAFLKAQVQFLVDSEQRRQRRGVE